MYVVAQASDSALFESVAYGVFDRAISVERVKEYLADAGHFIVVAVADNKIVGQVAAVIHRHPDKAPDLYLDEVGVADDYLRRGIATKLVERAIEEAVTRGCVGCWLATENGNVAAQALYRQWQPAGESVTMYQWNL